MTNCSIEATHELCENLESLIEIAKQSRASVRAISLIERAHTDLKVYLDEVKAAALAVAWSGLG